MPEQAKPLAHIRSVLGFDYGNKKIGVAVGQTITRTANGLQIIKSRNGKPDWDIISQLIASWQPDALIVGKPLDMDDTITDATAGACRFARQLEGRYKKTVLMADERLTSMVARMDNPRNGNEPLDDIAAKLIVETWLSEYDRNL